LHPEKNAVSSASGDAPVKVIAFVRKLPGLSREEFAQRWTQEHVRVSTKLGMSPYRINISVSGLNDEVPLFDGTAEMYWPSMTALRAALAGPQGLLAAEDTKQFASEVQLMIVDEHIVA